MDGMTTTVLRATGVGKRYGGRWALRDCSLALPPGRVAALVGPNGAGKTTLLQLAVGLTAPSAGSIEVCGALPWRQPARVLPRVGFVAQDQPLYRRFPVTDMLAMGRKLNPRWDDGLARARLRRLDIPLDRQTGALSGGQRSQMALTLALAKRPALLLLDEPVAALDPLARRAFLQEVSDAATEHELTVLLSSHIVADLERLCDYLIILSASQVLLAGDVVPLRAQHKRLVLPRAEADAAARDHTVVQGCHDTQRSTLLVRATGPAYPPSWQVHDASLEDIVLAYLGQSSERAGRRRAGEGVLT